MKKSFYIAVLGLVGLLSVVNADSCKSASVKHESKTTLHVEAVSEEANYLGRERFKVGNYKYGAYILGRWYWKGDMTVGQWDRFTFNGEKKTFWRWWDAEIRYNVAKSDGVHIAHGLIFVLTDLDMTDKEKAALLRHEDKWQKNRFYVNIYQEVKDGYTIDISDLEHDADLERIVNVSHHYKTRLVFIPDITK